MRNGQFLRKNVEAGLQSLCDCLRNYWAETAQLLDGDAHQGGTGRQLYRAGGGRLEDDAVSQSFSEGIAYLLHIFVVCHELLDLL